MIDSLVRFFWLFTEPVALCLVTCGQMMVLVVAHSTRGEHHCTAVHAAARLRMAAASTPQPAMVVFTTPEGGDNAPSGRWWQ